MRLFNKARALEIILYTYQSSNISHILMKETYLYLFSHLIYMADKKHLEEYGCLMCDNTYCASKYGPVPIEIYTALDKNDPEWFSSINFSLNNTISISRNYNNDPLSESRIECMDYAANLYKSEPFWKIAVNNCDAAWQYARLNMKESDLDMPRMDIEKIIMTIPNYENLLDYYRNPNP